MQYRIATIDDLPALLYFGEQLYLVERNFYTSVSYSKDEATTRYKKQFENPQALFLIVEDDDEKPAGYLYAHIDANKLCEVEVVYVDAQYRGRGIAQELVQRCREWAKSRHATSISTHIFVKNTASLHAFEKMGFQPHNIEYRLNFE